MTVLKSPVDKETAGAAGLDNMLMRIARGDTEAFEALYDATRVSVYSFALSIVKNTFDAEDVMQDCYTAVFTSAAEYEPGGKPLAWILTIVRNLCFQKLRMRRPDAELPTEDNDILLAAETGISAEDRLIIRECLEKLSAEERQIIILHAVSGFRHHEIAHFLDLPLATELSKYHRALKKLKRYLEA